MKLVVGLGNPGRKYVGTRHNIGFEVISELARRHAMGMRPKAKFEGELVETFYNNEKICLLCPLTFMNLSGKCVKPVMDFYKMSPDDLLVVCDDFNLPVAKLRFRPDGSAGGQNGLNDIIRQLGTQKFARLRVGIGKPPPEWDVSGYVLGKFDKADFAEMEKSVKRAADGVQVWLEEGVGVAMNRYNSTPNQKPAKNKPAKNKPAKNEPAKNEPAKETKHKTSKESDEGRLKQATLKTDPKAEQGMKAEQGDKGNGSNEQSD